MRICTGKDYPLALFSSTASMLMLLPGRLTASRHRAYCSSARRGARVKHSDSVFRVLFVEDEGLGQPRVDGVLNLSETTEYVRAGSLREARRLLEKGTFDLVVADESRLRRVIDAMFTFVGLFSLGGVVLDVNQAPLTESTLKREQVLGRRFIDMPWFAHSSEERARIEAAIASAAAGAPVRIETWIRRVRDGSPMCIDAAFAPLRDQNNIITHVIGSGVDVTARKRAEEALAGSQARLAEAQRVAHVGSWEWNVADNRVTWSDELFNIYAIDRRAFVPSYEGFLSRVHPDDVEHTVTVIRQALEAVTPFIYDHRIRRPDGSVRMLHTRGEAIADANGKAARLVGSCWDVTERWEAMQRLEHTVSTLTATLEATADGILVGDREGKVSALNRRFLALWRLPADIGPGADIRQLAEGVRDQLQDPDAFMAKVGELYGDLEKESCDILRFKDGRVFERYSLPQRLGTSICGRVCSFRDVTQREHLLETVEARRAEAQAAREQYETILERVSDGFTALDRSWRYTYVNTGGGRMLGRNARDLIGKHIWTEFPEGKGQKFQLAYEQAVEEQRPIQLRAFYPPWNRWYENRIYPSAAGLSIFFSDITEQVEAQEELRVSNGRLRALAARLDAIREEERRVIAREIHDQIGQALTALKLDVSWLRSQLPSGSSAAVAARAQAMEELVDQAVESAQRVSATLRPAILDDLGLAAAIRWQARDFTQRSGVACDLDLGPDGVALAPAIALTMFRILQEALTNVIRHAEAQNVHIGLTIDAANAVMVIADDGRGVTAEELERPTSLGIVGIRERALAVGGEVTITGSAGRGTTVTVRVPTRPGRES
jgi:PAS domain S-box-containing protein